MMESKKLGTIAKISLNISISVILAFIGLIFCYIFILYPQYRSEVTFVSAILGGLSTIYSAFYIGSSIKYKIIQDSIHNSFQLLKELHGVDIVRLRTLMDQNFDHRNLPPNEVYNNIVSEKELHTAVKSILVSFGNISIAIQRGYADEPTVFLSLNTFLPPTFEMLIPYIQRQIGVRP